MAGVLGKFLEYIGIEENGADDEVYEDVNYEDESRDNNVVNFGNRAKKNVQSESNVVSLPNAAQLKMIVYHPVSYEDTQNIIDNLKSRKPVIVNMEELDLDCAQRILDFMAGAIYALNGTIYKISRRHHLIRPTGRRTCCGGRNFSRGTAAYEQRRNHKQNLHARLLGLRCGGSGQLS